MSVSLVRFGVLAAASALALLGLVGCSDGTEDATLRRSQSSASARTSGPSNGTTSASEATPATSPPASSPDPAPAPAPDAGPTPAPAPAPPVAGSCGAPKCFGLAGIGGCKATDSAGDLVTMGCQDGACACVSGGQTTATFDGDVNDTDDARSVFLLNCTCN